MIGRRVRPRRAGPLLHSVVACVALMAAPHPLRAADCEVVARLDGSAAKHAVAGGLIYAASRALGASRGQGALLGIGANLVKEGVDTCRTGFDVGDLAAGTVGTLVVLVLELAADGVFEESGLEIGSPAGRGLLSVGFRFGL